MNINNTYNGKNLEQIEKNLPASMIEEHKQLYIENCKYVINNEAQKMNLDYCQTVRNANFNLILFYNHS